MPLVRHSYDVVSFEGTLTLRVVALRETAEAGTQT